MKGYYNKPEATTEAFKGTSWLHTGDLGRKDEDDAERWGWDCAVLTLIYGLLLSVLLVIFAKPILAVFLTNPDTRALAYWPMVLWALMIGFDCAGMVLMNALIGAGATRQAMWISVIAQWVFFLPAAWFVGPVLGFGLLGVWIVNGLYRFGQAAVLARQWAARQWVGIEI